jgi:hypothetical protein
MGLLAPETAAAVAAAADRQLPDAGAVCCGCRGPPGCSTPVSRTHAHTSSLSRGKASYSCPSLLVGTPFVVNYAFWPSVAIPVGNATLVVSK